MKSRVCYHGQHGRRAAIDFISSRKSQTLNLYIKRSSSDSLSMKFGSCFQFSGIRKRSVSTSGILIVQKLTVVREKIAVLKRLEMELGGALRQCHTALEKPS